MERGSKKSRAKHEYPSLMLLSLLIANAERVFTTTTTYHHYIYICTSI